MNSPESLYQQALIDHKSGLLQEACSKLKEAISLAPTNQDAYEALAVILYDLKDYDQAIDWIKRWIKLNPEAMMAQTNLSRCYVAKGMILEAEQAQAEARRLSWKLELKGKKAVMPPKDFSKQIEQYKKIIEFDPADVLGYYSLGQTYLDAHRFRDASDVFEKAVSVAPTHSASYLGLSLSLIELKDYRKAKDILDKGIEVADKQGDMVPLKKMEAHRRQVIEKIENAAD